MASNMKVGVLALQGDFQEHLAVLKRLHVSTQEVRLPADLEDVDRLIIPGGESTTIGKLLDMYGLLEPIRARIKKEMPVWGTCAGGIVLAKKISGGRSDQKTIGLFDITAKRNAFGRQLNSFETNIEFKGIKSPIHVAFIRAPLFEQPGKNVEILAKLDDTIVAAREINMLITSFHPEITGATALHEYFLGL